MNGLEKSLKEAEELFSVAETIISNVEKEFEEKKEDIISNFDKFGKAIDKQHEDAAFESEKIVMRWQIDLNKALRKLNKIEKMEKSLMDQVMNEGSENEKKIEIEIFEKINLKKKYVYCLKSSIELLIASWDTAIKFEQMGLKIGSDHS